MYEALLEHRKVAYTTVMTMMKILHEALHAYEIWVVGPLTVACVGESPYVAGSSYSPTSTASHAVKRPQDTWRGPPYLIAY